MNENVKKLLENSNYINKEIKENEINGSYYRWLTKEIKDSINVFTPCVESVQKIEKPQQAELLLNNDYKYDDNPSLEIKTSGIIKNGFSRSTCGVVIKFDKLNIDKYNRVSIWMNIKATGYQNFYFHFRLGKKGSTHTASVEVNKWQKIKEKMKQHLKYFYSGSNE
mgnify:CR=1 FL=1